MIIPVLLVALSCSMLGKAVLLKTIQFYDKQEIDMSDEGYTVDYDIPQTPATGETVATLEEAEEIKAERLKEGYVNVRIGSTTKQEAE